MLINAKVKCDECGTTVDVLDGTLGQTPEGWFSVQQGMGEGRYSSRQFCSKECLSDVSGEKKRVEEAIDRMLAAPAAETRPAAART